MNFNEFERLKHWKVKRGRLVVSIMSLIDRVIGMCIISCLRINKSVEVSKVFGNPPPL